MFDNTDSSKLTSILNIVKTFFICFVLAVGAICFSKDTNEMVLEPIESMVKKIKDISRNPIEAMQKNEEEDYIIDMFQKNEMKSRWCGSKSNKDEPLETIILEKTITKIGAV